MKKNNSNWKTIEEEFRKRYKEFSKRPNLKRPMPGLEREAILNFFKPYFQEQMHEKVVEELEAVDNTKPLKEI